MTGHATFCNGEQDAEREREREIWLRVDLWRYYNQYDSNGSSCLVLLHDKEALMSIFSMLETEKSTQTKTDLGLIYKIRFTYPY
jgi:hypothetical protein